MFYSRYLKFISVLLISSILTTSAWADADQLPWANQGAPGQLQPGYYVQTGPQTYSYPGYPANPGYPVAPTGYPTNPGYPGYPGYGYGYGAATYYSYPQASPDSSQYRSPYYQGYGYQSQAQQQYSYYRPAYPTNSDDAFCINTLNQLGSDGRLWQALKARAQEAQQEASSANAVFWGVAGVGAVATALTAIALPPLGIAVGIAGLILGWFKHKDAAEAQQRADLLAKQNACLDRAIARQRNLNYAYTNNMAMVPQYSMANYYKSYYPQNVQQPYNYYNYYNNYNNGTQRCPCYNNPPSSPVVTQPQPTVPATNNGSTAATTEPNPPPASPNLPPPALPPSDQQAHPNGGGDGE